MDNTNADSFSKGVCGVCSGYFKITQATGRLRKHGRKANGGECSGSYSNPIRILSPLPISSAVETNNLPTLNSIISEAEILHSLANTIDTDPIVFRQECATQFISQTAKKFDFDSNVISGLRDNLFLSRLSHIFKHKNQIPKLNHISKVIRPMFCRLLSKLISQTLADPKSISSWALLLSAPSIILSTPIRGGRKINLNKVIKQRINDFDFENIPEIIPREFEAYKIKSIDEKLSRAVKSKIDSGNIKAAIRLISDDSSIAPCNQETVDALRKIHPPSSIIADEITHPEVDFLEIETADLIKTIKSFTKGSASGPDGLSPQHLSELIVGLNSGDEFILLLTRLINQILSGDVPNKIASLLCGGSLTALAKKKGGLRPIAVGCVYRRLAAKCANKYAISTLGSYLSPLQIGVGISKGAEAAINATRTFINNLDDSKCLVKLDFANAFNTLKRNKILLASKIKLPLLFNFIRLCYSQNSILWYNGEIIESAEGVQQGDPLGSTIFALTVQPILLSLISEFKIAYIDDTTIGGKIDSVFQDVLNLETNALELGLTLCKNKCELFTHNLNYSNRFPSYKFQQMFDAELLGAPLFEGSLLDQTLESKVSSLELLINRLTLISSHDALTILRFSLSIPRLIHILRCSPCHNNKILIKFDYLMQKALASVTNVNLTETSWLQATLPVKFGGIGLKSAFNLAMPAFSACFLGSLNLSQLIYNRCSVNDSYFIHLRTEYINLFGEAALPALPESQKSWDSKFVEATKTQVMANLNNSQDMARFQALQTPHSGAWLEAWPLTSCGLRLSDDEIRIAIGLRLGANLSAPHKCNKCGADVKTDGVHGLSCRMSMGRHPRHSMLNEIIHRSLLKLNIPATREPTGLMLSNGKRPDGCTLIPWEQGKCLAWDATVPDTLAPSHVVHTSKIGGSAAEQAAIAKNLKYNALHTTHHFIPIAIETLGPINLEGELFLNKIATKLTSLTGDKNEKMYLYQRIGIAVQRGNAIAVSGTHVQSPQDL